jgi:YD repeat-containing protein
MMCLADEFRYVKLFSSSQTALGIIQGNHVTYSKATEYFGNNGENGKKEYVYTPGQTMQYGFPFAPVPNTDYKYGLLKESTTYRKKADGTYQMVHKLTNDYQINDEVGSANRTWMGGIKVQYTTKGQNQNECNASRYNAVKYQVLSEWYYLKRTQEITYDNSDVTGAPSVLTTTYHYDNPQHIQLTRTKTATSLADTLLTRLTYPLDYAIASPTGAPSVAIKAMQSQHIVSPVVEKQTWRKRSATDSTLVAAELTQYKSLSSGNVVPDTLLSLQVAQPLTLNTTNTPTPSSFSPLRVNASGALVRDGKYEERLQYEQYDAKGNPRQVRRADDVPTTYLWGYHSTYPIAEIKNATYAEVVAVLGQAVIDGLAGANPGTDAQVRQKLAPLRTDARLQKAQVTTYTYQPLVGRTSATDAAGVTTFYEYDDFQRLKRVKDQEGNIVKQNIYHYQGQP